MSGSGLTLGPDPGVLVVQVVVGDAWRSSLVLEDADTGSTTTWPEAPVLEFDGLNVTADLDKDQPSDATDSMAVWSMTSDQVGDLVSGSSVRLSVDGETWWIGSVTCLS